MPPRRPQSALGILTCAAACVTLLAGTAGDASARQAVTGGPFGPGRCGPVDPSYIRVANATGGQVLPLGPAEVGASAALMDASFDSETVLWATAPLASTGQAISVPVDGVTSRIAFVLSTDGSITEMSVTDPAGTLVSAGQGIDAFSFGCVRGFAIDRPAAGVWSVTAAGAGTYWFVVHAKSDLRLDGAEFVQTAGRPPHEGLFRIPGQPIAGRAAMLRGRITREQTADVVFDLVSMTGARVQDLDLAPVSPSPTEEEYFGAISALPSVPFRVRISGRDRTGALYQRVSRATFRAATVEVVAPRTMALSRGRLTPVTVIVRNVGAAARLQIVAVLNATVLRVEPGLLQLGANESRDVTVWAEAPADGILRAPEIVVTAESAADPAASNSAIIFATLDAAP